MTVPSERTVETRTWCVVSVVVVLVLVEVTSLNGPNVCMVKQKYNITKRVKYRAPMSIRTYEWCFSMPPRCSKWNTEMRDLTRLETEERTAEVAVCCPGYKMRDVTCVPICPNGKTGHGCSEDCPPNKWGPNCVHDCSSCDHGTCSPVTGECLCEDGWQGESCSASMPTTTSSTISMEETLTTAKPTTKTTLQTTTKPTEPTTRTTVTEVTVPSTTTMKVIVASSTTRTPPPTTTASTIKTTKPVTTTVATTSELFNHTITPAWTMQSNDMMKVPKNIIVTSNYNRTETPNEYTFVNNTVSTDVITTSTVKTTMPTTLTVTTTSLAPPTTAMPTTALIKLSVKDTMKSESPKKQDTTTKVTTLKNKPKEIWIRPTQREPEHITAVMTDKGRDHSTIDLISVISIAGGVMMAVITVAVIIVMVERCKRPRYEDVRKLNDIRMQVMIDNDDVPPPYVRSIFHTPLPDPPTSEKCHYQPISTLDRNLKQFMRPVVVQTISPIMLENFRGILECHYDHLPQRNYDCSTLSTRCSVTPSMACTEELRGERALSVTDFTIEALKCEAKLDVIDNTTSEPLYAEIPCWRPPSEHAIEVLNLNGEAVTEL